MPLELCSYMFFASVLGLFLLSVVVVAVFGVVVFLLMLWLLSTIVFFSSFLLSLLDVS